MKKSNIAYASCALIAALVVMPHASAFAVEDDFTPPSTLGVMRVDFDSHDDLDKFDLYSSFGSGFDIVNDCLWTNRSGEQKAILKGCFFSDFTVQADLVTPVKNAYIDGGFYIGVRGDTADGVDQINAYQVCVLRGGSHSVVSSEYPGCVVKIYKFSYVGGVSRYQFIKERSAIAPSELSVKATVEGQNLSVYICGNDDPAITYTMPDYEGGKIGFRTFYCQMGYDNLEIYSSVLNTDTQEIESLIAEAEKISGGTEKSMQGLSDALSAARAAAECGEQNIIDEACARLRHAMGAVVPTGTKSELMDLISQAELIDNDKYTENSYASLMSVVHRAKALQGDDEHAVSIFVMRLKECLDDLTPMLPEKESAL